MITPQSNPNLFQTQTHDGREFFVPWYVTHHMKMALDKAYREAYRAARPEECQPDIDIAKYNAWVLSPEGDAATTDEAKKILFIPKDGKPFDPDIIPVPAYQEAYSFFDRRLPDNTSALTDATAKSGNASTPVA